MHRRSSAVRTWACRLVLVLECGACGEETGSVPARQSVSQEPTRAGHESEVPHEIQGASATPIDNVPPAAAAEAYADQQPAAVHELGSLRLIVLRDHELLGSEERELGRLTSRLEQGSQRLVAGPPSEAERAFIDTTMRAVDEAGPIPAQWNAMELVVVLRLLQPRQVPNGKHVPRGRADCLLFAPPGPMPVLSVIVDVGDKPARGFDGAKLAAWIGEHVAMQKGEPR